MLAINRGYVADDPTLKMVDVIGHLSYWGIYDLFGRPFNRILFEPKYF
jgi:hypothetical protein